MEEKIQPQMDKMDADKEEDGLPACLGGRASSLPRCLMPRTVQARSPDSETAKMAVLHFKTGENTILLLKSDSILE
jgi:hypothetical protein